MEQASHVLEQNIAYEVEVRPSSSLDGGGGKNSNFKNQMFIKFNNFYFKFSNLWLSK